jgi:osmotically-inducible protein OsmY
VALSGFAKSQSEKDAAGQIASTTRGVREVRNNLIVRP